jgi:hypothetical protein
MQNDPTPVHGAAINVTLVTARLRLEPLDGRHAAPLFDGMRDPAIYEWISLQPSNDLTYLEARWTRVARRPLVGVDVLDFGWAVQRSADGAWIGKMDAEVTALGVANNVAGRYWPPPRSAASRCAAASSGRRMPAT